MPAVGYWICQQCNKKLAKKPTIQTFDEVEPTTIHVFCSETCKKKWITSYKKKQ